MHAVTASHTALRTTVLPIEATPTYAFSISTGVPAVFVRFVAQPSSTRSEARAGVAAVTRVPDQPVRTSIEKMP